MSAKVRLKLQRKAKGLLYRAGVHRLLGWVEHPLAMAAWTIRASRWIAAHRKLGYNDFYSPRRDYARRFKAFDHLVKTEALDGPIDYLEFGVMGGKSIGWWVERNPHPQSRFVGFDTFTGLPEDWDQFKQGEMTADGAPPAIDDPRCRFVAGLFQETLPGFLAGFERRSRLVVHMDADLYTSTLYVLTSIAPILRPGDVLLFDEFNVPLHEFRAFSEFVSAYRVRYEVLTAVNNYYQVTMKLL